MAENDAVGSSLHRPLTDQGPVIAAPDAELLPVVAERHQAAVGRDTSAKDRSWVIGRCRVGLLRVRVGLLRVLDRQNDHGKCPFDAIKRPG